MEQWFPALVTMCLITLSVCSALLIIQGDQGQLWLFISSKNGSVKIPKNWKAALKYISVDLPGKYNYVSLYLLCIQCQCVVDQVYLNVNTVHLNIPLLFPILKCKYSNVNIINLNNPLLFPIIKCKYRQPEYSASVSNT